MAFLKSSKHPIKKLIITIWLAIAVCTIIFSSWYFSSHSIAEVIDSFTNLGVTSFSVGAILFVFIIRTIIYIPLSILLISTPLILGDFWAGVLVSGIGEIVSASIQFWLSRIYGADFVAESKNKAIIGINQKISQFGSVSIALLRLLPVPFDLINLGAGMTKMKFSDYFWVTVFSVWPDCLSYAAIGQSTNNPLSLLYTGGITIIVFLVIWYLKDHPEYKNFLVIHLKEKTSLVRKKIKEWRKIKKNISSKNIH